jgi:hypothetical protein
MGVGISVLALVWHAARTGDPDATLPIISRDSDAPVPFLVAIAVEPHGAYIEYNFSGMPESAKSTRCSFALPRDFSRPWSPAPAHSCAGYDHRAELQLQGEAGHSASSIWLNLGRSHCLGVNAMFIEPEHFARVGDVRIAGLIRHSDGAKTSSCS